mmetsp:Transcript_10888/g.16590  ORF Transcript_10888/g.16590 Transcript_10888/m.16590 type:complete len:532 (+) Transcript_10888:34-1629(+)
MDHFQELLTPLVKESYIAQGLDAIKSRQNLLERLLREKRLPQTGWDDSTIEYVLQQLAMMDSNNFTGNVGLGEREGRVYSSLVARRHFSLAHGIGRSGNIAEVQPKAAGSSLTYKLTNLLVNHALCVSGCVGIERSLVVPMATGMTIALSLLTLKKKNPDAKYVIWPRIDQKSCIKAMLTVGLTPLIVENILEGDEISTNMGAIEQLMQEYGTEILCVLTTTSCFAPRRPDRIDRIAKLCEQHSIPHVINNAYGLQCPLISKLLSRAITVGRVDFVIQSTDKNFMVPVGGAVLSSPQAELIDEASKLYPGRASSSPILDLFITLLSMGENGLRELHEERLRCLPILIDGLSRVASQYGERVLVSPCNSISIGVTLSQSLCRQEVGSPDSVPMSDSRSTVDISYIGSMLFKRSVSGSRVVAAGGESTIGGHVFRGWGAHIASYHSSYLTVACAVGLREPEIHTFLNKMNKVFSSVRKSCIPRTPANQDSDISEVDRQDIGSSSVSNEPEAGGGAALSLQWIDAYKKKARDIS